MSKQELRRQDRSTRAKRYQAALNDELEKDENDQSFWNQEFFQGELVCSFYIQHPRSTDLALSCDRIQRSMSTTTTRRRKCPRMSPTAISM